MSSVFSVVESFFSPGARARAACRSSAVEPRGGMSMEGGRMTEIGEMPKEWRGTNNATADAQKPQERCTKGTKNQMNRSEGKHKDVMGKGDYEE